MKEAFRALSKRQALVPERIHLPVTDESLSLVMPVCDLKTLRFGLKVVNLADRNPDRGLPRIHGTILLFDRETGEPKSLMNAEKITALRTGAAVGMATDLLAPGNSSRLTLFGTGKQARSCAKAILAIRPIRQVDVFSRNHDRGREFCQQLEREHAVDFRWTTDRNRIRESEILCLATSSRSPLFEAGCLPPRFHMNAIGSYRSDQQEFDPAILSSTRIYVDQVSTCKKEAGEIFLGLKNGDIHESDLHAIGDALANPPPEEPAACTLFKSVGNAIQDLYVANHVYQRSLEKGLGQEVRF